MLYAYGKGDSEDITKTEAKVLDELVENLIKDYGS